MNCVSEYLLACIKIYPSNTSLWIDKDLASVCDNVKCDILDIAYETRAHYLIAKMCIVKRHTRHAIFPRT